MEKHDIDLIIEEVKHFDKLKERYGYADIDDLIAHYIEEQVIASEEELLKVINILKLTLMVEITSDLLWSDS